MPEPATRYDLHAENAPRAAAAARERAARAAGARQMLFPPRRGLVSCRCGAAPRRRLRVAPLMSRPACDTRNERKDMLRAMRVRLSHVDRRVPE